MLRLEVVQMLGQLPVDVLWQDAHRREEGTEDRQLLLQQLDLLLQPLVLSGEDFHTILRLPRSHLCFLPRFPYGHIISLPSSAVVVPSFIATVLFLWIVEVFWGAGEGL